MQPLCPFLIPVEIATNPTPFAVCGYIYEKIQVNISDGVDRYLYICVCVCVCVCVCGDNE